MAIAVGRDLLSAREYERFHARLIKACDAADENEGCWLWNPKSPGRYGQLSIGGRGRQAHVVSWSVENGSWPPGNLFVLHRCNVPSCIRPDHLYLGTHRQNHRDRRRRQKAGERAVADLWVRFNQQESTALREAAAAAKTTAAALIRFFLQEACGGTLESQRLAVAYIDRLTANVAKVGR